MMNKVLIETECPVCHTAYLIEVDEDKFERWQAGEHVQDVWPEKSTIQREQLISGVCSDECWDELWR
jgi:hypothetical protein